MIALVQDLGLGVRFPTEYAEKTDVTRTTAAEVNKSGSIPKSSISCLDSVDVLGNHTRLESDEPPQGGESSSLYESAISLMSFISITG